MNSADKKGGVCPVEDIGIQSVVAAARSVSAFDGDVVVTYLRAGHRGTVAVENNSTNRVQRPQ